MSDKNLFTVILEYDGGTYISQAKAETLSSALLLWAQQLKNEDLDTWTLDRADLLRIQAESAPVSVMECVNVWCLTGIAREKQVIVNIIKTAIAA